MEGPRVERLAERCIVATDLARSISPMTLPNPDASKSSHGLIRVMTVDDHPIFRDGLAALLAFYKEFELVAEAADGAQAVAMFRTRKPDVTLMDLSMPIMGGAQATEVITSEFPDARIIALTTYEGDADIFRALEAGARGYLLKDALRQQVAEAIRTVHRGARVVPSVVAQKLAEFTPRIE